MSKRQDDILSLSAFRQQLIEKAKDQIRKERQRIGVNADYNIISLYVKNNTGQAMMFDEDDHSFWSMDDEESTNTYVTIGYQESHIECSLLNYESLHDIEANSTYVDGVEVNGIDWINGAGSATGNSTLLQRIEITVGPEDNNNLPGNTDNGRWLDE